MTMDAPREVDRMRPDGAVRVSSFDAASDFAAFPGLYTAKGGEPPHLKIRRTVSAIIAWRKRRARFFPGDLFADPVWDMLLDLAVARIDGRPLQISYVGIEAGVASSTSLRWMKYLVARGLVRRWRDPLDKRRELVELSDEGLTAFLGYVDDVLEHAPIER
ncbi:hypothetical protein ACG3SL_09955 [Sphingomonas sp. CJ20]